MVYEPPVRSCCGQRHFGVTCLDGKTICCLCFDRFDMNSLSKDNDGDMTDVCILCRIKEEQQLAEKAYPNHHPITALANYRAGREIWDTNGDLR